MSFFMKKKWLSYYDHTEFDMIDLNQFFSSSFRYVASYMLMYVTILLQTAVFASDVYTAVVLLAFDRWSSQIEPFVPFRISRWLFSGCIILSVLLYIYDLIVACKVMRSKIISLTYTNPVARNLYSIYGYRYFCLFAKITKSRNRIEYMALYVFFQFRGWIRLVFADSPRQVLNGLTLYSVLKIGPHFIDTIKALATTHLIEAIVIVFMAFSFLVWVINVILFASALVLSCPLYAHVHKKCSGLDEYIFVKVNKRIALLLEKYHKKGLKKLVEENKKLAIQPTLPRVASVRDAFDDQKTLHSEKHPYDVFENTARIESHIVKPMNSNETMINDVLSRESSNKSATTLATAEQRPEVKPFSDMRPGLERMQEGPMQERAMKEARPTIQDIQAQMQVQIQQMQCQNASMQAQNAQTRHQPYARPPADIYHPLANINRPPPVIPLPPQRGPMAAVNVARPDAATGIPFRPSYYLPKDEENMERLPYANFEDPRQAPSIDAYGPGGLDGALREPTLPQVVLDDDEEPLVPSIVVDKHGSERGSERGSEHGSEHDSDAHDNDSILDSYLDSYTDMDSKRVRFRSNPPSVIGKHISVEVDGITPEIVQAQKDQITRYESSKLVSQTAHPINKDSMAHDGPTFDDLL